MGPNAAQMTANPLIYEIDTWPWLERLGRQAGRPVELATVPAAAWDGLAELGVDAVWLMGVWRRSPAGTAIAMADPRTWRSFHARPPRSRTRRRRRLAVLHPRLRRRRAPGRGRRPGRRAPGAGRPRHAADPGLRPQPRRTRPPVDRRAPGRLRGRDATTTLPAIRARSCGPATGCWPAGATRTSPPGPDVVQLDAFSPGLREAAADTLVGIPDQCDGVRCDMAMLLLNDVFARTWGDRVGPAPATEYWTRRDRRGARRPSGRVLIAEAYWDLEWELQQLGFDYCYDKRLYDRLVHGDAESVRPHLCADRAFQQGLVRFIENHDEPRAASAFPAGRQRGRGRRGPDPAGRPPAPRRPARGPPGPPARVPRPGSRRAAGPRARALVPGSSRRGATAGPPVREVGALRTIGLARQRPLDPARRLVLGGHRPRGRRPMAHRRQPRRRRPRRDT